MKEKALDDRGKLLVQDPLFQNVVSLSTGLGFGLMLVTLAALRSDKEHGWMFQWHWSLPLFLLLGLVCSWRFWKLVWSVETTPTAKSRQRLKLYFVLVMVVGLAGFLYPMRFATPSTRGDLMTGLVTAAIFLTIGGTIMYRLAQGVEKDS